ncbi:MAG: DUF2892 domain-containing protein [Alphaproteobacteria bacterium]|jgi:hypothetical protein|nr:DUF2892 domain-containing protein [Alphaproteobacteria bacterium]
MTRNIGSIDRIIRLVLGVALIALSTLSGIALFTAAPWQFVWLAAGVVLVATAVVRVCPLYLPFGLSTCKVK